MKRRFAMDTLVGPIRGFLLFLVILLSPVFSAWGLACGFDGCPLRRVAPSSTSDLEHFGFKDGWSFYPDSVSLDSSVVQLASGLDGYLIEEALSVSIVIHPHLSIGVSSAYLWILPSDSRWVGESVRGFANPLISLEGDVWANEHWKLNSGLQVALPFGNKRVGVAEEHWEVMPSVSLSYMLARYSVNLSIGFRESISSHEHGVDDSHPPSAEVAFTYADPTGSRELVTRAAFEWTNSDGDAVTRAFLDGMFPTNQEDIGTYFEVGFEAAIELFEDLALSANIGRGFYGEVIRAPLRSGISLQYTL